jgi:mono/diheme cytochrome c family protein
MRVLSRSLASLVTIIALTVVPVRAQEDLDQHKTGAQLFAADCVTCHHSPRGLAKNQFSLALWSFLRQHYTSSDASAQKLTAYLESMDTPRSTSRRATRISSDTAGSARPPRPPLPVPTH